MEGRALLHALSVMKNGDWNAIFEAVKSKENIDNRYVESVLNIGYEFTTLLDSEYPDNLKHTVRPPFVIFYEGNIELMSAETKKICVANDNLSSSYSQESINKISKELADKRILVLPFNNKRNTELIKKVVDVGGKVIAVMDRGIGKENSCDKELFEELAAHHLVLSVFPRTVYKRTINTEISSSALLVGVSDSLLVGGISRKTPASSTLAFALEQGKNVYSIPFPIGSNYMNNSLIREGAILVESGSQIIEEEGE